MDLTKISFFIQVNITYIINSYGNLSHNQGKLKIVRQNKKHGVNRVFDNHTDVFVPIDESNDPRIYDGGVRVA